MTKIDRREMFRGGAALVAAAAFGARGAAAAPDPLAADPLAFVAPELRPAARAMQQMAGRMPRWSVEALPAIRKGGLAPPVRDDVPIAERRVPGGKGAPDVTLYIVNAKAGEGRPGILHTHGGGFITGSARSEAGRLQALALALDCVVVSVDYRLAPETRFSGSIEDNYAGLRWMHGHAAEIGVDPARIAVMGESAGGGHAALLAITARDRGEVPVLFQALIYPMLDDRTGSSRAVPPHIGTLLWTAEANRFGWGSFLGRAPGGANVPAGAVPARTANLAGLPPAFIGVGGIDLFVEEDIDYARRLIVAGVPAELLVVPGAFHGFDGIGADTTLAKTFTAAKLAALRRAFANAGRT